MSINENHIISTIPKKKFEVCKILYKIIKYLHKITVVANFCMITGHNYLNRSNFGLLQPASYVIVVSGIYGIDFLSSPLENNIISKYYKVRLLMTSLPKAV